MTFGFPVGGLAVERADRDFHFLGEVAPIDDAVVAALKDEGISVLDAVGVHAPLIVRRTGRRDSRDRSAAGSGRPRC